MEWPLAKNTLTKIEMSFAFQRLLENDKFTCGPIVSQFEKQIAEFIGTKYCVMVNSGSSANLLMIAALCDLSILKPGDKVLVPAVSWSTTYFPLEQYGIIPVFVDVDHEGIIDVSKVNLKDHPETKAILAVNLLGNTINLEEIYAFCQKNKLFLLEDNCEAFGSCYSDQDKMRSGSGALMSTNSFYFSHQLNGIEGGCITTNHKELRDVLLSLRAHGWTRDQKEDSTLWQPTGNDFEDSFKFVTKGYCLRPQEINAAVGQASLANLYEESKDRHLNCVHFYNVVSHFHDVFTHEWIIDKRYNNFALPLFFEDISLKALVVKALKDNGIDTRPIIGGNFLNHPVMRKIKHETIGAFTNSEFLDKRGILLGNYGEDLSPQIDKFSRILKELCD